MEEVCDAWRHDALGWLPHTPGVDDTPMAAVAPVAAPRAANALGVDVSAHQGVVNWPAVAASGRDFVYIKATEGVGYINPDLDVQYQGAVAAGLKVGLYAFADTAATAAANAAFFAAQVNRLGAVAGHLPPCLDLETGTGNLSQWAQQFIAELRAKTGCLRVMLYSGASFFANQIGEQWMDQNIALWIASWGTAPGKPSYGSPRTALHQYSSSGQVQGVAGAVDLNWAIWDLATLIPSEAPPVTTTPPAATTASGLNADQAAQLLAAYQQLSGSAIMGAWTGWPTWPGGTNESLTLVDYARRANVQLVALKASVDALKTQAAITPGVPSALSDADISKIAAAVAGMLASKLSKP